MGIEIEDMPVEVFKDMYLHVNKGTACVGYVALNKEGKVVFEVFDVEGNQHLVELSQEDLLLIIKGMQALEERLCGR